MLHPILVYVLFALNFSVSGYCLFRKPRQVQIHTHTHEETTHTVYVKDAPSGAAECSVCNRAVARYTSQPDGSVICHNCKG